MSHHTACLYTSLNKMHVSMMVSLYVCLLPVRAPSSMADELENAAFDYRAMNDAVDAGIVFG